MGTFRHVLKIRWFMQIAETVVGAAIFDYGPFGPTGIAVPFMTKEQIIQIARVSTVLMHFPNLMSYTLSLANRDAQSDRPATAQVTVGQSGFSGPTGEYSYLGPHGLPRRGFQSGFSKTRRPSRLGR